MPAKETVGGVITHEELDMLAVKHHARVRQLSEVSVVSAAGEKRKYMLAFLENCGIAIYSYQDSSVWVLEFREMIELARGAGIDKEMPLIVVPGQGGNRG